MTHSDRESRRDGGSGGPHLDEGTLQEWIDRDRSGIDPRRSGEIRTHLDECHRCARLLAQMEAVDRRVGDVLAATELEHEAVPDYEDVLARAESRRGKPAPSWRRNVGWAAAVVVALGVGWMANEVSRSQGIAPGARSTTAPQEQAPRGASDESEAGADAVDAARADRPATQPEPSAEERLAESTRGEPPGDAAPTTLGDSEAAPTTFSDTEAAVATTPLADSAADAAGADAGRPGLGSAFVLRGMVTDSRGAALPGTQVYLPGSGLGALSTQDGTFEIAVPRSELPASRADGIAVRAELIGYAAAVQTITPGSRDTVSANFTLPPEEVALGEVVVQAERDPAAPPTPAPEAAADLTPDQERSRTRARQAALSDRRRPDSIAEVEARTRAEGIATDAVQWSSVNRGEAEVRVGFTLVTIPDLEVVAIEVGRLHGAPVVRIRQRLDADTEVTLLERRLGPFVGRWTRVDGEPAVMIRRGDVVVTAFGGVEPDSLEALVGRAR